MTKNSTNNLEKYECGDFKMCNMNKLLELINSVKATNGHNEVELLGCKESFDKLIKFGFPLEAYRHQETPFDESKIITIPCKPKPIKIYLEGKGDQNYEFM